MQLAVMSDDGKVQLPPEVIRQFPSKEKFVVAIEGNVILLNAIQKPKLSAIAERKRKKQMSIEDIVKEVHLYRQERKKNKRMVLGSNLENRIQNPKFVKNSIFKV